MELMLQVITVLGSIATALGSTITIFWAIYEAWQNRGQTSFLQKVKNLCTFVVLLCLMMFFVMLFIANARQAKAWAGRPEG